MVNRIPLINLLGSINHENKKIKKLITKKAETYAKILLGVFGTKICKECGRFMIRIYSL